MKGRHIKVTGAVSVIWVRYVTKLWTPGQNRGFWLLVRSRLWEDGGETKSSHSLLLSVCIAHDKQIGAAFPANVILSIRAQWRTKWIECSLNWQKIKGSLEKTRPDIGFWRNYHIEEGRAFLPAMSIAHQHPTLWLRQKDENQWKDHLQVAAANQPSPMVAGPAHSGVCGDCQPARLLSQCELCIAQLHTGLLIGRRLLEFAEIWIMSVAKNVPGIGASRWRLDIAFEGRGKKVNNSWFSFLLLSPSDWRFGM